MQNTFNRLLTWSILNDFTKHITGYVAFTVLTADNSKQ